MKTLHFTLLISALLGISVSADDAVDIKLKHQEGASRVADLQDELSADVQQLTIEQTEPQVIELLTKVEEIMDETTDKLAESDTGGNTLAAQTEIIEKIHAAAKAKQQQSSGGQSGSAMMDMMERMMGKQPEGDKAGQGKGDMPGDQAGQGNGGNSDEANNPSENAGDLKAEARRVPKSSGTAGQSLPEEFRKALDAYNRGAEQKVK